MAKYVAIELGTHAAKAVVVETSGRGSKITGTFQVPVGDSGADAVPSLGERLVALDGLLAEHRDWASPTVTVDLVWPGPSAVVRVVHLPLTDRAQVEQALPFAIEAEVPFDLDEMALGWRALSSAGSTRALVGIVRQEEVSAAVDALRERGLDPHLVALDEEVVGAFAPDSGPVAVLDVGHQGSRVSVFVDGKLVHAHPIDVGGRRFTRAIAEAGQLSFPDAERLKHGEVPPDEDPTEGGDAALPVLPPAARAAVDGVFGLLLAEVRSTLIDAEDTLGVEIDRILLTGGGSRLEPLADYLSRDLGIPVERPALPSGALPPELDVAAGLATLRAAGRPLVDLRVGKLAFKGGVNVLGAVASYGSAGVAFFLLAAGIVFAVQYTRLSREQAEVDARIEEIVRTAAPDVSDAILDDSQTVSGYMEGLALAEEDRAEKLAGNTAVPPTIDVLYRLTQAFPPHPDVVVNVSDLTISPSAVTFVAETDGFEQSARVEQVLQANADFASATKSNERRTRDKVEFTMTIPRGEAVDEGGG
jgi:Tfp pilus assembly PilM family ATPase